MTAANGQPAHPAPFAKIVAFWAPRRFVTTEGIDVDGFVADINDKILRRGFVLWDRQVLTRPLDRVGASDVIFEPDSLDAPFEAPARSKWLLPQRTYFGLENPYQMADEDDPFTWSHIVTSVVEPYLRPGELIAGLLHGERDDHYFYCTCHYATVVYTNRQRLVCMSCGATHVVLQEPLPIGTARLLTAEDWAELFDDDGIRRDEEVALSTVDFRDIESVETIWATDQWEDAAHQFVFFARSSPEEIAEAIKGTEADPSVFLEAGWTRVSLPPPPAFQVMEGSIDVNLSENAQHAYRDGVADFLAAYIHPDRLVSAVPQLFRAIELLLKAKLELLDEHALDDRPSNPIVLDRLRLRGVDVAPNEVDAITRLRLLRNDLQHGRAKFNHRAGLALCRRTIIFLDRFTTDELGLWIGDVTDESEWQKLLAIPEIVARAERIVERRLDVFRRDPRASITVCPRCKRLAMLRPRTETGATCALCGHVPVARQR